MNNYRMLSFRSGVFLSIILGILFCLIVPTAILAKGNHKLTANRTSIDDLPLTELPVSDAKNDILAIIFSGDGGWADLDKVFGAAFQKRGISTVGFDCLKYFWKTRQPAEVSQDVDAMVRYYLQAWNKKRVLLVGYSFGADWLPFLINRLPSDILHQVHLCVFLGPGSFVNVEVHVMDWMGNDRREGALEVLPEALQVKQPVLCVYGEKEENSICPLLKGDNVKKLMMPGGHHFDHEYDPIINSIFNNMEEMKAHQNKKMQEVEKQDPQK